MLCVFCHPDMPAGENPLTRIPMMFAGIQVLSLLHLANRCFRSLTFARLQDLVLTPVATAITILTGRFTLSDNPNPALAAAVMCGLALSWIHWAAFSVLDPVSITIGFMLRCFRLTNHSRAQVATRFGMEENPRAQWPALIFVTRLFEVASRTLFIGCVGAAYGPKVLLLLL